MHIKDIPELYQHEFQLNLQSKYFYVTIIPLSHSLKLQKKSLIFDKFSQLSKLTFLLSVQIRIHPVRSLCLALRYPPRSLSLFYPGADLSASPQQWPGEAAQFLLVAKTQLSPAFPARPLTVPPVSSSSFEIRDYLAWLWFRLNCFLAYSTHGSVSLCGF